LDKQISATASKMKRLIDAANKINVRIEKAVASARALTNDLAHSLNELGMLATSMTPVKTAQAPKPTASAVKPAAPAQKPQGQKQGDNKKPSDQKAKTADQQKAKGADQQKPQGKSSDGKKVKDKQRK